MEPEALLAHEAARPRRAWLRAFTAAARATAGAPPPRARREQRRRPRGARGVLAAAAAASPGADDDDLLGAIGNVSLQVTNQHEQRMGRKFGDGYYQDIYPHLVELYQPTELALEGIDDVECSWKIGAAPEAHVGHPITVIFEAAGAHDVIATCQRGGTGPWIGGCARTRSRPSTCARS